jgi:pimeloyl-ACP methyl ester carboxylesterase
LAIEVLLRAFGARDLVRNRRLAPVTMLPATAGPLDTIRAMERTRATASDLPAPVAAALANPTPGVRGTVDVDGLHWATLRWGDSDAPPVLLVHGVTSDSDTFWRIGPAIAASGRHVVAADLPGHGRTRGWSGRHRFAETAADLFAFIRASGLERDDLVVLGHSWGGMVVAELPAAGVRPATLILLDPPALPRAGMELMTRDPNERHYDNFGEAVGVIRAAYPGWTEGDVLAKASGLHRFEVVAARAVLLSNGDWDAGLAALADPAATDVPVWYIRGEFTHGSLIPAAVVPALAARAGGDHVLTIAGGPHSPQRTHPEATVLAILRAIAG